MQYGLSLPNFGEFFSPRRLADLAREAEAAGWDGFFLWDHVLAWPMPMVDPWVALTWWLEDVSPWAFGWRGDESWRPSTTCNCACDAARRVVPWNRRRGLCLRLHWR